MKRLLELIILFLVAIGCNNETVDTGPHIVDPPPFVDVSYDTTVPWTLIFDEEFDGTSLNTGSWNFDLGDGCPNLCQWGNQEGQIYTDSNHKFIDGTLVITVDTGPSSTRINTKSKKEFGYSRVEAMIKLPTGGSGLWPAFWMLGSQGGWPDNGEIDIMEYVSRQPNTIHNALHTRSSHGATENHKQTYVQDPENWHLYAIEWSSRQIDFFIDDTKTYTYKPNVQTTENWPFNKAFYLVLNVAVGGTFGGSIDNSIYPSEMHVDYIKVYERQQL